MSFTKDELETLKWAEDKTPILEAVVDRRFDKELTENKAREVLEKIVIKLNQETSLDFSYSETDVKKHDDLHLHIDLESAQESSQVKKFALVKLQSSDSKWTAIVLKQGIALIQNFGYSSSEELFSNFLLMNKVFCRETKPAKSVRLALRCINKINVDSSLNFRAGLKNIFSESNFGFLNDTYELNPKLFSLFFNIESASEPFYEANIKTIFDSSKSTENDNDASVFIDLDTFSVEQIKAEDELALNEKLNELRKFRNLTFNQLFRHEYLSMVKRK